MKRTNVSNYLSQTFSVLALSALPQCMLACTVASDEQEAESSPSTEIIGERTSALSASFSIAVRDHVSFQDRHAFEIYGPLPSRICQNGTCRDVTYVPTVICNGEKVDARPVPRPPNADGQLNVDIPQQKTGTTCTFELAQYAFEWKYSNVASVNLRAPEMEVGGIIDYGEGADTRRFFEVYGRYDGAGAVRAIVRCHGEEIPNVISYGIVSPGQINITTPRIPGPVACTFTIVRENDGIATPAFKKRVGAREDDGSESAYVRYARDGFRYGWSTFGSLRVRKAQGDFGTFGQAGNSTGRPIGGGLGYGDWILAPSDGGIRTYEQLEWELNSHTDAVAAAIRENRSIPLKTVYVAGDAWIDIKGNTLRLPPGLTLASNRGQNFALGAMIMSADEIYTPAFELIPRSHFCVWAGLPADRCAWLQLPAVRITGFRFFGPNPWETALDSSSGGRMGIRAFEAGSRDRTRNIVDRVLEIDNNEFAAWPALAIEIAGMNGGYVHHNYIHHSRRHGEHSWSHALGYGVNTNNGLVYIEANRFDYNRHSVATRGDGFTQYVAMFNSVEHAGPSHSFDVHGGSDRGDGTHVAGQSIVVAYNTIWDTGSEDSVVVRGIPTEQAWVTRNEFSGNIESVKQTKTSATWWTCYVVGQCKGPNMSVWDNRFLFMRNGGPSNSTPSTPRPNPSEQPETDPRHPDRPQRHVD